jgi:hypothetical protein
VSNGRCPNCLRVMSTGGCPNCPTVVVPPSTITVTFPTTVWFDARPCTYCGLPEASHTGPNKQCPRSPSYKPKDF